MGKDGGMFGGGKNKVYRDDGCIGSRKVRTITFSMLLIAFMCMGLAYFFDQQDAWTVLSDRDLCDKCEDSKHAWDMIVAGALTVIAFSILSILLVLVNCGDKICQPGVGLIIGAALYIIGWTWYIALYHDLFIVSDDAETRINEMLAAWFGEALLPSACAFLLGLDVFMHILDDESNRLASNLLMIAVVSFMTGPIYYTLSEDADSVTISTGFYPYNSDAYPWIATGYMVLGVCCVVYVFLYVFKCCTCDCKDSKVVRLLMALGLIVGGVLAASGYWIYAAELSSHSDDATNYTLYYEGYAVAIAGFPIMWALDVGIDT